MSEDDFDRDEDFLASGPLADMEEVSDEAEAGPETEVDEETGERVRKRKKWKCRGCWYEAEVKWRGVCPSCGRPYDIVMNRPDRSEQDRVSVANAQHAKPKVYVSTKIEEMDRVIGGGLVPGSTILFGGPPGIGKTTILMQIANAVAAQGFQVLYASVEQNKDDLFDYAHRMGLFEKKLGVIGDEGDVYKIVNQAEACRAKLLILDSISEAFCPDSDADAGQVAQVDAGALYIYSWCKKRKTMGILIGHVNNDGEFAGGQKLRHRVDTLLKMDYAVVTDEDGQIVEGTEAVRELSIYAGKNRNGRTDVRAMVEMTDKGMTPLSIELVRKMSRLHLVEG